MKVIDIFPETSLNSLLQARQWLLLGLGALIAAGLFSILLVLSRTPAIQEHIPFIDFFHVALVVHVNLSVLIWFMAFACVMWSFISEGNLNIYAQVSFYAALMGTLIISLGPFVGVGDPILNNYIPTLNHPGFFCGLIIFSVGVLVRILITTVSTKLVLVRLNLADMIRYSILMACFVTLLAVWSLWQSYKGLPESLVGEAYFEFLYWGAGHVLQFNHSLLMLLAWLILLIASGREVALKPKFILWMAAFSVLPVLDAFRIYFSYDIYTPEHRAAFTQLMRFGGLSTLPFGLYLAWVFFSEKTGKEKQASLFNVALICSATLFIAGGVIGFLIDGVNVVIPAHYHGSIVGVTLAFMGLSYVFLPLLGYAQPKIKMAKIQLYTSAAGQILHITGLAWSGGYGVQRKTAGLDQGLERFEQIAGMGLMGLGGAVSIVGGVLFLVVMIVAIRNKESVEG